MQQHLLDNGIYKMKQDILVDSCMPRDEEREKHKHKRNIEANNIIIAEISEKEYMDFPGLFDKLRNTLKLLEQRIVFSLSLNDVEELLGESLKLFGIRLD